MSTRSASAPANMSLPGCSCSSLLHCPRGLEVTAPHSLCSPVCQSTSDVLVNELVWVSCGCTVPYLYIPDFTSSARVYISCWHVIGSICRLRLSAFCVCELNIWSQLCSVCPNGRALSCTSHSGRRETHAPNLPRFASGPTSASM